jgi:hypothetical protein
MPSRRSDSDSAKEENGAGYGSLLFWYVDAWAGRNWSVARATNPPGRFAIVRVARARPPHASSGPAQMGGFQRVGTYL